MQQQEYGNAGQSGHRIFLLLFTAISAAGACAADPNPADITGKYRYPGADDTGGGRDPIGMGIGIIEIDNKPDSNEYLVEITTAARGGMGVSSCQFYGTGKVSGDFLLVSNTLSYKETSIPVTLKIHLRRNQELDGLAKKHNAPIFSKLKPGQIAIVNEGELPSQLPKELGVSLGKYGNWTFTTQESQEHLRLPNGDPVFQGGFSDEKAYLMEASFSAVYTKETAVAAPPANKQSRTPPSR